MNFCGLGASNFKNSSFHVGESSHAPLLLRRTNESQRGNETRCRYGLRRVSDDPNDPKHLRRIANRRSARRSRERKQKYLTDLEEQEKRLQGTVTVLTTKIAVMTLRNKQLQLDKRMLEERMYNLTLKTKIHKVRIESAKFEIKKMMELRNLGMAKNVDEPDLTLSLALPGIKAR